MNDNLKNIINSMTFLIVIISICICNIIIKDSDISIVERRKLATFPKLTVTSLINNDFHNKFDSYVTDQFILRNEFRIIKTFMQLNIFKQKDNNSLYIYKNYIIKNEKLDENSIENAVKKIEEIYDKYLQGMNVFYSIIPDKSYFVKDTSNYIGINYSKLIEKLKINPDIIYIDIFDELKLEDYYKLDTHWKQERLENVIKKLAKKMNFSVNNKTQYKKNIIKDFYGVYYGQLAYNMQPEEIIYLTNETLEKAKVYNYENNEITGIYNLNFKNDKYDIFLYGSQALLEIKNPNATTNKELIIFRDSFGSSIAPLLLEYYSKIILIDNRYIDTDMISDYITFENQDVLFLYSTILLNNSYSLK